jgi:hypothetical protein
MSRYTPILAAHLRGLSLGYALDVSEDYQWVLVRGFRLPPGFNAYDAEVLLEMPHDYPSTPPGVSSRVYLPQSLRFHGRPLQNLNPGTTPGWGTWAWFCYQWIAWNPHRDDLAKFVEMIRADLTNPPTQ